MKIDLSKFKVLIVEDYSFISNILALSLREMGVGEVITAENGAIAQQEIARFNDTEHDDNIDLIILDWLMPVMDGKDFLQWLRSYEREPVKFLPVIICSAYTSRNFVDEARDMGANEVIVKPISATKLANRIQYVINHPRPFIKNRTFFGPNRRRQQKSFEHDDRRKTKPQDARK